MPKDTEVGFAYILYLGNIFGSLGKKTMKNAKSIDALTEVVSVTKGLLGKKKVKRKTRRV